MAGGSIVKNKIFLLLISFVTTHANLSKTHRDFVKNHSLPESPLLKKADQIFSRPEIIKAIENKDSQKLIATGFRLYETWGNVIAEHKSLDGWVIKYGNRSIQDNSSNIRRIINAEKIDSIIKENNLKHVIVPKKYLYHIPGKGDRLINSNYLVFAQKLNLIEKGYSSLPQDAINEALLIIKKMGMCDGQSKNLPITETNKIAFIDTEPFLELGTGWWEVVERMGLRTIRGEIGASIFLNTVKEDKRNNYAQKTREIIITAEGDIKLEPKTDIAISK